METNKFKAILKQINKISIDFDGTIMPLFHNCTFINPNKICCRPVYNFFEKILVNYIQSKQHLFPHFKTVLNSFDKKKELIVLTSRQDHLVKQTNTYLVTHGIRDYFTKVIHNQKHQTPWIQKQEIIKKESIGLHIEDDSYTISKLSNNLPNVFFIYFNHQDKYTPYNHDNTIEVKTWSDIQKILD